MAKYNLLEDDDIFDEEDDLTENEPVAGLEEDKQEIDTSDDIDIDIDEDLLNIESTDTILDDQEIQEDIEAYHGLPFAKRWLMKKFMPVRVEIALRQLQQVGAVQGFPPLVEKTRGLVSQAEHTLLVTDSGCEVLTK